MANGEILKAILDLQTSIHRKFDKQGEEIAGVREDVAVLKDRGSVVTPCDFGVETRAIQSGHLKEELKTARTKNERVLDALWKVATAFVIAFLVYKLGF